MSFSVTLGELEKKNGCNKQRAIYWFKYLFSTFMYVYVFFFLESEQHSEYTFCAYVFSC